MFSSGDAKKDETIYSLVDFLSRMSSDVSDAGPDDRESRENERIIRDFAADVTSLDVTDRSDIVMIYDDRITVEMGNINDLERKIRMCSEIIDRYPDDEEGTIVALSDGGYSFRDKASLDRSEVIYESNISRYNETMTTAEEEEENDESSEEDDSGDSGDGDDAEETRAPEMRE